MKKSIVTKNAKETQRIAHEFARAMKGGETLLLFGNLGVGKTTFMQGFAKGLGIKQRIISPTFLIMRSYEVKKNKKRPAGQLYHVDMYRLDSEAAIEQVGITEHMGKERNITAIEWPEKLGKFLPKKRIEIKFSSLSETERSIDITYV